MKNKLAIVASILVFMATLVAGCQTDSNKNHNTNTAAKGGNANKGDWSISREEFERQKERFKREAKDLGRKIGDNSEDLWIWTKTRGALAYADDFRDATIDVDVENDVVTLSGTVPNEAQKAKAEEIARSIEGVKSVKNDITVSASQGAG
jgi:osmotically-inducible protein OsmY